MAAEVVVGTVGDAHELAPLLAGEAEAVLHVDRSCGVVRTVLLRHVDALHVLRVDAQIDEPVPARLDPVLEPLLRLGGRGEELDLHLLELAGAEDEIARGDLVAEGLADLADAERRLLAARREHVGEVHEDALGGLRSHVVQAGLVVDHAEIRLDQAGERLGLGVLPLGAAVRARDLGETSLGLAPLARLEVLDEVVGTEPLVALQALDQRVGERRDVPRCLPDPLGQDDGRVEADHVAPAPHECLPPLAADVLLELRAEGAVVPGTAGTPVDLPRLEDEPAMTGEADDLVETGLFGHGGSNGRMRRGSTAIDPAGHPNPIGAPQGDSAPDCECDRDGRY
ncbi:hypothetical protein ABE10_01595, partial [Bacillus toyonensis]|nr:hypothetical protein [Bacillus toyonensis]